MNTLGLTVHAWKKKKEHSFSVVGVITAVTEGEIVVEGQRNK